MITGQVPLFAAVANAGKAVTGTCAEAIVAGDTIALIAVCDGGSEMLDPAVPIVDAAGNVYTVGASIKPADGALIVPGGLLPVGATLTRASVGTRHDATGALVTEAANVARFDHDPATGALKGLLIEGAATNLALWSDDLTNAAWGKVGLTAPGTGQVREMVANTSHNLTEFVTVAAGQPYSFSALLGAISDAPERFVFLRFDAVGFGVQKTVVFDLATGAFAGDVADIAPRATLDTDGQWLVSVTMIATAAVSSPFRFTLHRLFQIFASAYAGGPNAGANITRIQIEAGAKRTSSIATAGAPVTRAADVLTLDWASKGVADGATTLTYTFDDGSTQEVATVIAGGVSIVPTDLARPHLHGVSAPGNKAFAFVAKPIGNLQVAWCIGALPMAAGGFIRATWANNKGAHILVAMKLPGGVTVLDRLGNNRGVSGAPLQTSGILAQRNEEITIFPLFVFDGADETAFVEDESVIPGGEIVSPRGGMLRWAHRIPPSKSPVIYRPSMTQHAWLTQAATFRGEPVPIPMRRVSRTFLAPPPLPLPPEPAYGLQCSPARQSPPGSGVRTYLKLLEQMPCVSNFRMGASELTDFALLAGDIGPLAAYGVGALLNCKHKVPGENLEVAVDDPVAYKQWFHDLLDYFPGQINWLTIGNERNTTNNGVAYVARGVPATEAQLADRAWSQTIADTTAALILEQMTYAAQAVAEWNYAHPLQPQVKVSAGGFSSSGIKTGRWYDYWINGHHDLADYFAGEVFAGPNDEGIKLSDIPSSEFPDRPILGENTKAWLNLLILRNLHAGMRFTEMPRASVHLITRAEIVVPMIDATRWAVNGFGLPCIMDAIGQKDDSPLTPAGIAGIGRELGLELVSLFADEGDNAESAFNPLTGLLNERGRIWNWEWSGRPGPIPH